MIPKTGFVVLLNPDGVWEAHFANLPFEVETPATRQDVRIGCQEIARVINMQEFANIVVSTSPSTPSISDGMREALKKRSANN